MSDKATSAADCGSECNAGLGSLPEPPATDGVRGLAWQEYTAELGAVLTYEDQGGHGAHGQTLGADGRGWFSVLLFYGTPDDARRAAGEYLRTQRAAGRRIRNECVVTNEDSYSGPNVRAVVVGA